MAPLESLYPNSWIQLSKSSIQIIGYFSGGFVFLFIFFFFLKIKLIILSNFFGIHLGYVNWHDISFQGIKFDVGMIFERVSHLEDT